MPLDDLADVLAGGPHDAGQQHGRDNAIHLCGLTTESHESTYRVPVSNPPLMPGGVRVAHGKITPAGLASHR